MILLAVDPGPTQSAWLTLNTETGGIRNLAVSPGLHRIAAWLFGCAVCGMPSWWDALTEPGVGFRPSRRHRRHLIWCPLRAGR